LVSADLRQISFEDSPTKTEADAALEVMRQPLEGGQQRLRLVAQLFVSQPQDSV